MPTLDDVASRLWDTAGPVDAAACYPATEIALLGQAALLAAALPGGPLIVDSERLCDTLTRIGAASLPVGRLYEGHVDAATLAHAHAGDGPAAILADEVGAGRISAVWNAERGGGAIATRTGGGWTIAGTKVHCSGVGGFELAAVGGGGRAASGNTDRRSGERLSAIHAYVDAARGQFETLALAGIEAARRNVGLGSFIAPDPLDRVIRDLETYLRQPFLDASRDAAARYLLPRRGCFSR